MTKQSNWVKKSRKYNQPLREVYSKVGDKKEETGAKKAMDHFVTDSGGSVYALTPYVPELFAALLKARYSRTELSAKQLLWREFVEKKNKIPWKTIDKGRNLLNDVLNFQRAEGVAERILLQYGDDSVFELGGAHLFLDRISMIATKIIEDIRIGLSPLEKSTRYVIYDQKGQDGDYAYFKDPKLIESKYKKIFLETSRACFDLYTKAIAIFLDHYKKQLPIENQEFADLSNKNVLTKFTDLKDEKSIKAAQIAYNASVRAKACDVSRVLLPASTVTNVGIFGNARAFGYLITKMLISGFSEIKMLGSETLIELKKVLPKFFDPVDNNYGLAYQEYLQKTEEVLQKRASFLLKGIKPEKVERVELVQMDKNPEINIAAALIYPYCDLPLRQLLKIVKESGEKVISQIIFESLMYRKNRRHKPPRAFEIAGYELVFDILGNFGIYRDLQRQRMLTQQRQKYTCQHGFDMPAEFSEVGLDKDFIDLMMKVKTANKIIAKDFPLESQYLTNMAHLTRWYMGMNLREGFWMTELRSVPQGHFSYRTIAQDMYIKACKVYPFLKKLSFGQEEFVDMSDRSKNLERIEAMQKIQVRLAQFEDKYEN